MIGAYNLEFLNEYIIVIVIGAIGLVTQAYQIYKLKKLVLTKPQLDAYVDQITNSMPEPDKNTLNLLEQSFTEIQAILENCDGIANSNSDEVTRKLEDIYTLLKDIQISMTHLYEREKIMNEIRTRRLDGVISNE